MDKLEREILEHLSGTVDKILLILQKPKNRLVTIFEIAAAGVGILGILSIIDIIRTWIGANMFFQIIVSIALILISISLFAMARYIRNTSK